MDLADLLKMSQVELDKLFMSSVSGEIPDGDAKGTAIFAPGKSQNETLARWIRFFAWQGKIFDAKNGTLCNKISPFGFHAITAQVYKAPSWTDGRDCIVLDYSKTTLFFRNVRDEIREIKPLLFLGNAYWRGKRRIAFALEFGSTGRRA